MKEGYPNDNEITQRPLFEIEFQTFESLLPSLLETHEGQWALIKETDLGGIFPKQSEAINAGYEMYGNAMFLTRQILEKQPQHFYNFAQAA